MSTRTPLRASRRIIAVALAGATLALSGCVVGERPTLAESPTPTGDAAVDAVLSLLDAAGDATFTASYDVLTRFGDLRSVATVAQDGPTRRSITVGSVRFLFDSATSATCLLDSGECSDTIDAGLISDTQLAPDFYASSAAARLRRDAAARVEPTTASTETIGGQVATCVTIPVTDSSSTYCAVDSGALARVDAADVVIELTSYAAEPDEQQFARTAD